MSSHSLLVIWICICTILLSLQISVVGKQILDEIKKLDRRALENPTTPKTGPVD